MPHPRQHLPALANKPAYIMADTGQSVSYQELEDQANQVAHAFRKLGIQSKDHVGMMLENHPKFMVIAWAAFRSGICLTPISHHLLADETAYILGNCEAKLFITSKKLEGIGSKTAQKASTVTHFYMLDGTTDQYQSFDELIKSCPTTPIEDELLGNAMLYSSGTTGQPKGVYIPPPSEDVLVMSPVLVAMGENFKFGPHTTYLSPAPLYHAAPFYYNMVTMMFGGTSIIMSKFDPEKSLAYIEQYKANYSQWVPIMFVRMLKMDAAIREKYDVSSMKLAMHAAAPCPIEIKEKMIDWWGPVVFEYYGASEGMGMTAITSQEWLAHKGSVGRAIVGIPYILDDAGKELPAGEIGDVYFTGGNEFEYYKEEAKTKATCLADGKRSVGDVGYLDKDGYLYLTDRKNFTIISGGVNIYPQEIENHLINHPKVADVAVFGIPNEEFGQEVKAVIQPSNWADAGEDLAIELTAFCKEKLSRIKIPRSFSFDPELPRKDNGKLYKRRIVEQYSE